MAKLQPESQFQSQTRDARAQTRNAEKWALREEGDEQEAGDRDRSRGGAPRRRQGSREKIVPEVEPQINPQVDEAQVVEEVGS